MLIGKTFCLKYNKHRRFTYNLPRIQWVRVKHGHKKRRSTHN